MQEFKKDTVYLLVGEEGFLKDEFIKKVKNKFLDESNRKLNFISFSAKDTKIDDILTNAKTAPFLGKKRVVVVKDINKLNQKGKDSILSFVKKPTETTCLVLESSKPSLSDEFLNSISKYAVLIKAQRPSYGALDHWIKQRLLSSKKRISKEGANVLKELTGDNLQLLSAEVDKVVSYVGDKNEVTLSDVEAVVGKSIKENVFRIVDYISKKDVSGALLLSKNLLKEGKRANEIIGLIGWHFRRVLSAKLAIQKGRDKDAIFRELGVRHFYINKFTELLNNFKVDELKEKLKLLFIADRQIKTSSSKPEFILDVLMSRLCAT